MPDDEQRLSDEEDYSIEERLTYEYDLVREEILKSSIDNPIDFLLIERIANDENHIETDINGGIAFFQSSALARPILTIPSLNFSLQEAQSFG